MAAAQAAGGPRGPGGPAYFDGKVRAELGCCPHAPLPTYLPPHSLQMGLSAKPQPTLRHPPLAALPALQAIWGNGSNEALNNASGSES